MDLDSILYSIIAIMFISYILGLCLSFLEKKGKSSILSSMGNAGFINIFGVNTPTPDEIIQQRALEQQLQQQDVKQEAQQNQYVDSEIL